MLSIQRKDGRVDRVAELGTGVYRFQRELESLRRELSHAGSEQIPLRVREPVSPDGHSIHGPRGTLVFIDFADHVRSTPPDEGEAVPSNCATGS